MEMTKNEAPGKRKPDLAEAVIAMVSGLAFALTAVYLCVAPLSRDVAASRDYIVYWSTAHQLVLHGNPYDKEAINRIERGAGLDPGYGILFMRNPPWALPIVYFLGFVGLRLGTFFWSLVLLACLLSSIWLLWRMHGRPNQILSFLGYAFGPALICLIAGQTSLFALLGFVLFLEWHRTRPFCAGMALWLCTLKPHLFLVFAVVLLAWVVIHRCYRLLLGTAAAMAVSCLLAWAIDPHAWTEYAAMMRSSGIEREFIPCLSVCLHLSVSPQSIWLQYLPVTIACIWALWYFWRRRATWDWKTDGSFILLVSVFAAPYCWVFDQALAVPALLYAAFITRSRLLLAILPLATAPIMIGQILGLPFTSLFYVWTTPLWLAWYLVAIALRKPPGQEPEPLPPNQVVP